MRVMDCRGPMALVCVLALLYPPVAALGQDPPEPQYKLIIVRGDNAQNNLKKGRATRPVVEVRDRNNKPVAGALVLFTLPSSGPSGTFVGGGQVASVTTNSAGQASASFTANSVSGKFNVSVSSNINGQTITAQISTANIVSTALSATTLAVILGVIGAAGVGTAIALTRDGGAAAPAGIRIGPGTGTVTPPR